jgi:vitamin B12 transporter
MYLKLIKISPLLVLVLSPLGTVAQNEAALENVLVTGSYSPRANLTSSVSVLESQQIRSLNKRTVTGLLKTLPGVLVEEQGGPGGLTAVSIRGAEANFTLVLLDGVPVNDPTNFRGGSYDFGNLSPDLVERIEVVRGAQSAVYGSDALAGVINIITRKPTAGHSQQVFGELGEDDYSKLGFNALGKLGAVDYTIELVTRDDGEPVAGSSRDSDKARLRLGWQMASGHLLEANYSYLDGDRTSYPEQGGGPEYSLSDSLDEADYRDEVFALSWQANFSPTWRSVINGSRFEHTEDYLSPGIMPYTEVPPNAADTDFQRDHLQWVNSLAVGDSYQLDLGADYRDEEGESTGYLEFGGFRLPTDFELDRSTVGVFAELFVGDIEDILLQGSVRHDDPDGFDSETSLHLGLSYALSQRLTLSANWGEAFKLPSFFALGHALVGNPELQPEKATSWDLGARWVATESLQLQTTMFYNDYKDLIDFDPETFTNVNRKRVETSGVEAQLVWQPRAALSLSGQVTYTDIDVEDSASLLTGRPEWTAGVVTQWQIISRWSTMLDYRYTGEQYAASVHTGESITEELDDYHRLDWVLHWQPRGPLQLRLSIDNLLDEDYRTAVGFPGVGRAVRLGFSFTHR